MVSSASPIKILCSCKLQRDHLMSVGQRNNGRSRCPHDVKRDGRNIRERAMVLLCRLGRLQMGEETSGSSFWVAGWLGCTAILVGGVGCSSSSRVHLGEGEMRPTTRRERRRRVLMTEGSDTKLRIIGRLNQLVSQHFLYMCVCVCVCVCSAIYNSNGEVTTQEYDYNISYIVYFIYRYINSQHINIWLPFP